MDFYRINEDYNRYLQNYEKEIIPVIHTGFHAVPGLRK